MWPNEKSAGSQSKVGVIRARAVALLVFSSIHLVLACPAVAQTNEVVPAAGGLQPPPVAPSATGMAPGSDLAGLMDAFDYDPRGRRDPFAEPIPDKPVPQGMDHGPALPLQKFELAQLRLVGIIWDVRKPKAMIKDPSGATHIVGPNTKLGPRNGYIAVIREGEIVVVETIDQEGRLISTAQVVKIAK